MTGTCDTSGEMRNAYKMFEKWSGSVDYRGDDGVNIKMYLR
jgi:hypothetical protein